MEDSDISKAIIGFLRDGPKTQKHIASLLGFDSSKNTAYRLEKIMKNLPVYREEDETGCWRLIEKRIKKYEPVKFRLRGQPLVRYNFMDGIGGINVLWGR